MRDNVRQILMSVRAAALEEPRAGGPNLALAPLGRPSTAPCHLVLLEGREGQSLVTLEGREGQSLVTLEGREGQSLVA